MFINSTWDTTQTSYTCYVCKPCYYTYVSAVCFLFLFCEHNHTPSEKKTMTGMQVVTGKYKVSGLGARPIHSAYNRLLSKSSGTGNMRLEFRRYTIQILTISMITAISYPKM